MLDLHLRMVSTEDIGELIQGEEIQRRWDDDADMRLARKIEYMERVNIRVGEVTDERRLHRTVDESIVSL